MRRLFEHSLSPLSLLPLASSQTEFHNFTDSCLEMKNKYWTFPRTTHLLCIRCIKFSVCIWLIKYVMNTCCFRFIYFSSVSTVCCEAPAPLLPTRARPRAEVCVDMGVLGGSGGWGSDWGVCLKCLQGQPPPSLLPGKILSPFIMCCSPTT